MSDGDILNNAELEEKLLKLKQSTDSTQGSRLKKFKNSLDSDEDDDEEEAKNYDILNPEELDGQEEATIDRDGEIQIMPFNMKEELEEGYFNKDGTYVFTKEKSAIKDQWLDNIDWVKIKTDHVKRERRESSDSDRELPELDILEHYRKMLEIMHPNETVQKAICRLGGGKSGSRKHGNRWKKNKGENSSENSADKERNGDYEKLHELTSLASEILQTGNMDIYQQTYERLKFLVNMHGSSANLPGSKISLSEDVDDALDMFGDHFDAKASSASKNSAEPVTKEERNIPGDYDIDSNEEVMWEFKWEHTPDAPVYGPRPTSEMLRWVQEGYFADGVWVRQVGKPDASFYSSRRIDFELYL